MSSQWYMRVQRGKIKVFKKPLFHAVFLEFAICDQQTQYFADCDRYEVTISYFKQVESTQFS